MTIGSHPFVEQDLKADGSSRPSAWWLTGMPTPDARPANGTVLNGTALTAKGGAVRASKRYTLVFTCSLTPDHMRAISFTFQLGAEIAKQRWDEYGLWALRSGSCQ